MGYHSEVAFAYTKKNWEKLCELAKTNDMANSEYNSFNSLLDNADIDRDVDDYHIVCWRDIKWYTGEGDGIDFMDTVGRNDVPCEYMRIGEDPGDIEEESDLDDCFFMHDGNRIDIDGITMDFYSKDRMLKSIVKAFIKAAPDAARKWKEERGDKYYGGSEEFENMFQSLYLKED